MAFSITTAGTRRQRIDAGDLLDVSRLAHNHRIVIPTAITSAAWNVSGGRPVDFATARGDALAGRILAAARSQAVHSVPGRLMASALGFAIEDAHGRIVELELQVGPGDDGGPAATIDLADF